MCMHGIVGCLQRIKKHHSRPGMQKTKSRLLSRGKHQMGKQYLQYCVLQNTYFGEYVSITSEVYCMKHSDKQIIIAMHVWECNEYDM